MSFPDTAHPRPIAVIDLSAQQKGSRDRAVRTPETLPALALPMSTDLLRLCLDALDWSQHGLAARLGLNDSTVRKWARGAKPIPDVVAKWLHPIAAAVSARPVPPEWKQRARDATISA